MAPVNSLTLSFADIDTPAIASDHVCRCVPYRFFNAAAGMAFKSVPGAFPRPV
jgi:hypothetical protein